jgi:tetratricopeptide (TPR) repeat protein
MGRHDLLREAQQYAVNRQHAKALELLQRYLARCLAAPGTEDAAERIAMGDAAAAVNASTRSATPSRDGAISPKPGGAGGSGGAPAAASSSSSWTRSRGVAPATASRVMAPPPDTRGCSDLAGAGKAYRNMGYVLLEMNQPKAAVDAYENGLKIARQTRDRRAEAKCLASMGAAHERNGQYDHCISLCSEAEVMSREAGNRKGEAVAVANAAVALATMGQYAHSIRLHERALLMAQACGDAEGVDVVQENLQSTRDKTA